MSQEHVTETLTEWLHSTGFDDFPPDVRRKSADVIFDSIGGMIACSTLPEVKIIVEFALESGGKPECTVIGQKGRTSAVNAAMANGAMAHGDEVDPVHLSSAGGHVAAGPVPTALTIGQLINTTGKDLLRAVALGYEVGGRLMTIFYRERDYTTRRFYHTAVAGVVSSAVTASLLLGLDRQTLQVAIGLAAYQAAGPDNMTRDPGHMGKTFQVGAANRNGVTAALLAQKGCSVPSDSLEGPCGLLDTYLGNRETASELLQGLGDYFAITDVMHKRYPVGSPNQTYLQALLHLLREHQVPPDEIQEIEIQMPTRSVRRVPTSRHASISGEMVAAIAAARGKLDFYELHDPAAVADPAIQKMRPRIRFVGRDDWKDLEHGRHAIVALRLKSGRSFEEEVWFPPMTTEELREKFRSLVQPRLGDEKTRRVERLIYDLENAVTVRPLLEELEG